MPSDLAGLLVFVALLAPGFCHLLVRERQLRPGRAEPSALREIAGIGLVSATCNVAVLLGYMFLSQTNDRLLSIQPFLFNEDGIWRKNLTGGVVLMASLLGLASVLAYAWAAFVVPARVHSGLSRFGLTRWLLPHGDLDITSSWWQVLQMECADSFRHVTCQLDDGRSLEGWLRSYNNRADESGDRDLVLAAPIKIQRAETPAVWQRHGLVVVSARNIVTLQVNYFEQGPES